MSTDDILTTDEYWDCDCIHFYIHPKTDACCEICGAVREECPDSRVSEVLTSGYIITPKRALCPNCGREHTGTICGGFGACRK